jgi:hypothetical protein
MKAKAGRLVPRLACLRAHMVAFLGYPGQKQLLGQDIEEAQEQARSQQESLRV